MKPDPAPEDRRAVDHHRPHDREGGRCDRAWCGVRCSARWCSTRRAAITRASPPSPHERSSRRRSGATAALAAVTGPARQLDTIEGFVAWRMFGLLIVVGAIWGLLTRDPPAARGGGRRTVGAPPGRPDDAPPRHRCRRSAGLTAGFAVLWTLTAGLHRRRRIPLERRLLSVGLAVLRHRERPRAAAIFLAIGALTSQLGPNAPSGQRAGGRGLCRGRS